FWSITMPLLARDLWCRVLCDKLLTGIYLHQIDRRPSSNCPLLLSSAETRSHFFFTCPKKRFLWTSALGTLYPWLAFSDEHISNTLLHLHIPSAINKPLHQQYLSLVAVIQ
ncbi:MAG: hypothetical protein EXX96DRAFT_460589, partial [Benjaminiella poitrasii]